MANVYEGHRGWVTSIKLNPRVENVFISSSLDGTVRLWDLRNNEAPVALLKHKQYVSEGTEVNVNDLKMFAAEWNGSS